MENGNNYKVAATVPEVVSLLGRIVVPPGTWEASNDLPKACFSTPVHKDNQAFFFYLTSLLFYLEVILILQSSFNLVHKSLEDFPFPHSITEVHYTVYITLPGPNELEAATTLDFS